jgi:ribonucleoside-diphosphate reductase alpha chain
MLSTAGGAARVDWERLRATTSIAVRFLDDVVEVSRYPIPEITQMARGNRKIGLGVMGFAEMLIRLGLPYDSDAAAALGEEVMRVIADQALAASAALAAERGVFANWERSVYARTGLRLRNATRTAVAPTGTLSIIADTTAGIEPLFALAYRRTQVLGGQTLVEANPLFMNTLAARGIEFDRALAAVLASGRGQDADAIPADLRRLFVTALEIPIERHLRIQAAFQMHVDNAVSKTINLPQGATPDDVARAYLEAWRLGLKGITIYRYGSKSTQVLVLGAGEASYQYDHAIRCDPDECRV